MYTHQQQNSLTNFRLTVSTLNYLTEANNSQQAVHRAVPNFFNSYQFWQSQANCPTGHPVDGRVQSSPPWLTVTTSGACSHVASIRDVPEVLEWTRLPSFFCVRNIFDVVSALSLFQSKSSETSDKIDREIEPSSHWCGALTGASASWFDRAPWFRTRVLVRKEIVSQYFRLQPGLGRFGIWVSLRYSYGLRTSSRLSCAVVAPGAVTERHRHGYY